MIFLYTGAKSPDGFQADPAQSLGGYISSSPLPNGVTNNIFPTITRTDVQQNNKWTRLIVFQNLSGSTLNDVRLWTTITAINPPTPGGYSKIKIAAVAPAIDPKCNFPFFESIPNGQSIPIQAVLDFHEGEVNAINVGNIAPNALFGIWIRRELNMDAFTTADGKPGPTAEFTCTEESIAALEAAQQAENLLKEDDWQLIVDYV